MRKRIKKNELRVMIREEVEKALNCYERKVIKENFRRSHCHVKSLNEDVMARFYGIKSNGNRPVLVEAITLDRLLKKHGANGMINISANRSDLDQGTNDANTQRLIKDIKSSGFSYLPTYGGYRGTDGIEDDYEPSFIVFNYGVDGNPRDFDELKSLAITWCKKYNQDSVLVKAPNKSPIYLNANGEKVNTRESDMYWKNDPSQEFFTSLKDKDGVNMEILEKLKGQYKSYCHANNIPLTTEGFKDFVEQNRNNIDSIGRRYTYDIGFDECYVNPMPVQMVERRRRKGEVMIWDI